MKKRILSLVLTIALLLRLLPFAGVGTITSKAVEIPGYNSHDLNKMVDFLLQEDESDKTNAQKLGWNVDNPATWPVWSIIDDENRLKSISLYSKDLYGTLDLSGCTALETLNCYNNHLTKLDLSGCNKLTELLCYRNDLTELTLTDCTSLKKLNCSSNSQLTELDLSSCNSLKKLYCINNNQLTELDLSSCPMLDHLYCSDNNQLTKLDLSKCTALFWLVCNNNSQLTELNLLGCAKLLWAECKNNKLTKLDVSGCSNLGYLECNNNQLTELDVSDCPKYLNIYAHYNPLENIEEIKALEKNLFIYTEDGYNYSIYRKEDITITVKSIGRGIAYADWEYYVILVVGYDEPYLPIFWVYPEEGYEFLRWEDPVGLYMIGNKAVLTSDNASITAVFSGDSPPPLGDVNGDGSITTLDALLTLHAASGKKTLCEDEALAADIDKNGKITTVDALQILQRVTDKTSN